MQACAYMFVIDKLRLFVKRTLLSHQWQRIGSYLTFVMISTGAARQGVV